MSYQVALLNFEGPLDLLLQLVERSRLEVTEISLGDVTAQYVSHIEQLDNVSPDELHLFLEMAARLMLLKSRALLPTVAHDEDLADVAELRAQLDTYRRYQAASQLLLDLVKSPNVSLRRARGDNLAETDLPAPTNVSTDRLSQAFSEILRRLPPSINIPDPTPITLADLKDSLVSRLASGPVTLAQWSQAFRTRGELVVGFLALLELIKEGGVSATQSDAFDDIMIRNE